MQPPTRRGSSLAGGMILFVALLLISISCGDTSASDAPRIVVPGGDEDRGATAIREYGCGSCHTIPGVSGADGTVGPPLTKYGLRDYVAGNMENTPDNLIGWVMNAQAYEPGTAMPNLGVTEAEARDIAAYLESLR